MKVKSISIITVCVALAASLTVAYTSVSYAANSNSQMLATGKVTLTAQAKMLTVPTVSKVKLKSYAMGEITVTSKEPKIDGRTLSGYKYSPTASGLKFKGYTFRYSYNKNMKGAKVKINPYSSTSINKLKKGKRVYVQVRASMTDGKKTVYSAWSKTKSVKVDMKHKYTYALLKKPKYFNSWDECWAYCKKQPEVSVFMQGYIKLVKKVNGKWVED